MLEEFLDTLRRWTITSSVIAVFVVVFILLVILVPFMFCWCLERLQIVSFDHTSTGDSKIDAAKSLKSSSDATKSKAD